MSLQHQVAQRIKISQALRHLLALDQKETHVKPEAHERLPGERFRLRNLVFMMREDQVFSARVQIKALAEFLHRHDRALQVPAGASRTDRALPGSLARLGRLPKRKVSRAVFI